MILRKLSQNPDSASSANPGASEKGVDFVVIENNRAARINPWRSLPGVSEDSPRVLTGRSFRRVTGNPPGSPLNGLPGLLVLLSTGPFRRAA